MDNEAKEAKKGKKKKPKAKPKKKTKKLKTSEVTPYESMGSLEDTKNLEETGMDDELLEEGDDYDDET
jgi:hypothetical protein